MMWLYRISVSIILSLSCCFLLMFFLHSIPVFPFTASHQLTLMHSSCLSPSFPPAFSLSRAKPSSTKSERKGERGEAFMGKSS